MPTIRIWTAIIAAVCGVCLMHTCGCGSVAANYPPRADPRPDLPEEHRTRRGDPTELVWVESDQLRGFLERTDDAAIRARRFEHLADMSGDPALRARSDHYFALAAAGLGLVDLAVYLGRGARFGLRQGDLEITLGDRTVVSDQGMLVSQLDALSSRSSRDGPVDLDAATVGRGEPLSVTVLLPMRDVRRGIVAISIAR
jgi:hypothetical protein